jgi:rubrerythrin
METKFSVFEILEIAEQVEERGAQFYVKAADLFEPENIRDFYYQLAEKKVKQRKIWTQMRKDFSEKTGEFGVFDPDNYVLSNPEVMAGLTWFGTKGSGTKRLTGQETMEEILKDAIRRENAVITFYQGLKDFARDPSSTETLDEIISTANRYVLHLIDQINRLP